jgi:ParB-like chromosome segregation protein Spo0J
MKQDKTNIVQIDLQERRVNWRHLLVLPQMRKVFDPEKLRELAYNIAAHGILNPPIVAILPEGEFWKYAEYVCKVWKVQLTAVDTKKLKAGKRSNHYHVIVAGERRLRALEILWNEGCLVCREKNHGRKVTGGKCLKKHLGTEIVTVRVPRTKDHRRLLATQLAENVYDRPLPHEEAEAVAMLTTFLKSENPKVSYANIAKRIGRTAELVSRSMAFYSLPASIRNLVREKRIKYGIAIELARLKDKANYSEEQLVCEAVIAGSNRQYAKVEEFRKHVSGLILEHDRSKFANDNSLQMLFAKASPEERIKGGIQSQTILYARTLTSFFSKTMHLWEHPEIMPFLSGKQLTLGGLLDDYETIAKTMLQMIPYIEKAVSVEDAKLLRQNIQATVVVIRRKRHYNKSVA